MIEPIENHNFNVEAKHPHIVYRHGDCGLDGNSSLLCNTTGNLARNIAKDSRMLAKRDSQKTDTRTYTIEVLAVLDRSLLDYHRVLDVENYVLTLFNMVSILNWIPQQILVESTESMVAESHSVHPNKNLIFPQFSEKEIKP